MKKTSILKNLLESSYPLIMPDAYDPLSAKLIEISGFKAVQCSGYSFSLSKCLKKESDLTLENNLEITRQIVKAVNIPVMADAEDGYTKNNRIEDTVEKFIKSGVAGINIEDQIFHDGSGTKIIDAQEMIDKIENARNAVNKVDSDFIINGRTDSLLISQNPSENLKIAIKRANLYLNAGADLAFIPYVDTIDQVKVISKKVKGPVSIAMGLHYNINNFTIGDLKNLGVARISLPNILIHSSIKVMKKALESVHNDEISKFSDIGLLASKDDLKNITN